MSSNPEKSASSLLLDLYFTHGLAPARLNFPQWHLRMLADRARLRFYRDVLRDSAKGKVVIDLGAGSGVLSHLALKAGAAHVYAVEHSELHQTLLSHTLRAAISAGQVTLLHKDARYLAPADFTRGTPEVVVSELFSADLFRESVVEIHAALQKNLAPLRLSYLPARMELWASPVACPSLDESFPLEDFEGFSLSALNGLWRPPVRWVDHRAMQASPMPERGTAVLLYQGELASPRPPGDLEADLTFDAGATHLRLFFKLRAQEHEYDSSRLTPDSHWANLLVQLPPGARQRGTTHVRLHDMNRGFQSAEFS